jgi:hypothetical protein
LNALSTLRSSARFEKEQEEQEQEEQERVTLSLDSAYIYSCPGVCAWEEGFV